MAKHGIFESTKLYGCMNVSFVATEDVDNGSIIANGGLADGQRDVYVANKPTSTDKVYVVGHPAWGYDDRRAEEKNEDLYTNEAGCIFRTYELKPDRKFKVSSNMITPIDESTPIAKGQYVSVNGTYKMVASADEPASATFVGIVEDVEETGFPYFGSSAGVKVDEMGYVFDTRMVKVKIRVIKNG